MTLREALLSGPGLDGYAWDSDTFCVPCGRTIIVESFQEDGENVQDRLLPYPIFFGEHEIAQHCANCGAYLYGSEE